MDRSWPPRGRSVSASRWTLADLVALVAVAAVAAQFGASGSPGLAVSLLLFVVSTRVAIVDYSWPGAVATAVVMCAGLSFIFLAIFWTLE